MKILSNTEDDNLKNKVKDEIGYHHPPEQGWQPVELENPFVVPWHGSDSYHEYLSRTLDLIGQEVEELYALIFETDQYVPEARELFKEKYDGNSVEASLDEVEEISEDLIIFYLVPENMEWVILSDNDGRIKFSGKIRSKAEKEFSEIK